MTGGVVPHGAAYALAEAFTRDWWDQCGGRSHTLQDDFARAKHRKLIELPRAEKLIRQLWALPKLERDALASCLRNPRGPICQVRP